MNALSIIQAMTPLDIAQVRDLRRSVLCGELNWPREAVEDPADGASQLLLANLGAKPVGSLRLIKRGGEFHVECLAVLQRFRMSGVGRALLSEAEARAAGSLQALVPQAQAVFFLRCGFQGSQAVAGGLLRLEKTLP